jgi:hypothetical protein
MPDLWNPDPDDVGEPGGPPEPAPAGREDTPAR